MKHYLCCKCFFGQKSCAHQPKLMRSFQVLKGDVFGKLVNCSVISQGLELLPVLPHQ